MFGFKKRKPISEEGVWRFYGGYPSPFANFGELIQKSQMDMNKSWQESNKELEGRIIDPWGRWKAVSLEYNQRQSTYIKKIIVNQRTVIVIWGDNTKTKTTCSKDDTFDLMVGFSVCLAKKMYGKKRLAKIFKKTQYQGVK
jgi:hypothetical protein